MGLEICFEAKRAWVTGGTRGIGRAVALGLARGGADVGITYARDHEAAAQVISDLRQLGTNSWSRAADVSDPNAADGALDFMRRYWGPDCLDIVVANAGVWTPHPAAVTELSPAQWRRTLSVNLDGVFHTVRCALKLMRAEGRIVIVGSAAGVRGEPLHSDYAASKGALGAFAKAVCIEVAARGITVNCVAPGWCDTDMVAPALQGNDRAQIECSIPRGRIGTVEDIAWPILFLCSPQAGHITGTVIPITGGATI